MKRHHEHGFAMIWAMFLVVMVGALGSVILERDQTIRRDTVTDATAVTSFHAAEGGLAEARHRLRSDPDWAGAVLDIGPQRVEVTVTRDGAGWRVRAVATAPSAITGKMGSDPIFPVIGSVEADLGPSAGLPAVRAWRRLH